jgi:hypothetical protein
VSARRPVLVVVAAVLIGAACWYFGMDVPHAVTVAVALLAVGVAWFVADGDDATEWAHGAAAPGEGVRQDVSRLAWSLRAHRAGIPAAGLRRVHQLAAERLGRRGLDVDSPADRAAIERMLGRAAYSVLHPGDRRIRLTTVIACLDALDWLETHAPTRRTTP